MKIINHKNICHIVLNKIFIEVSDIRVWYYFLIYGRVIGVGPSGHIGPYEHVLISMNTFSSAHRVKYGTIIAILAWRAIGP